MSDAPQTLWYTRCPVPTAFSIALQTGRIDEELAGDGLQIASLGASADPRVRQTHFTQEQPQLFRHGGNVPALVARSRGADVRLIGLSWTDFYEPVLVLPDSPIASVADLQGRRIAVPRRLNDPVDWWRPTALHGYERALATAGLTLDDVELVDVPVSRTFVEILSGEGDARASLHGAFSLLAHHREEAVALITGRVDAIWSHASLGAYLQGITGARTLIDVGALPDRRQRVNNGIPLTFTVTGDLLERRPDVVARVLARSIEAADWARTNVAAARRIVAAEVGLPDELVGLAYTEDLADQLDVDLRPERLEGLEAQAAWLHRAGFLDAPVDVGSFVDPRPLEAARALLADRAGAGVGA